MRPSMLIWLMLTLWCSSTEFTEALSMSLPGCPSTCGNLTIPYPFGIGTSCARDGFRLSCNHSFTPPKTFLDESNIEFHSISLLQGQVRVLLYRAYDCHKKDGSVVDSMKATPNLGLGYPYTFSSMHNKFTVIGCDTIGYIYGSKFKAFSSGCISMCDQLEKAVNGSCTGFGCCQTVIPTGLKHYQIFVGSYFNHTEVWDFNPCSYAFLVAEDSFTFNRMDMTKNSVYRSTVEKLPVVLDWVAANETCKEAIRDNSRYACRSNHSECYESTSSATGYLCNCSQGYEGNPYLVGGCQDIDECKRWEEYPCIGVCINHQGNYSCACPKGTKGDPKTYGCIKDKKPTLVILATIIPSLSGAIIIIFLYGLFEKRKRTQLALKFYKQNGGTILEQHISTHAHIQSMLKIFRKEELESATYKFDENKILGRGGQGMVYEGTLEDNTKVAIKKSMLIDGARINDFINEIIILSQISHKNVVRLLGCCLEVEIPYLVYEFIPNNTLFHHIHKQQLPWGARLRIAADAASALSHLHTKAAVPIYHQDVKSTNILLDKDYTAKVSDFGASKLAPTDKEALNTLVQGTLGYLDPEYLQTHELTDKSGVYSFGVVLLELLTGKEPLSYERSEKERCLAQYFRLCMEENTLIDILDPGILTVVSSEIMTQMREVAKLANRCLNLKGKERPDMMEVCLELEGLWRSSTHPWVTAQAIDEKEYLLSEQGLNVEDNQQTTYFNSGTHGHDVAAFSIDAGR